MDRTDKEWDFHDWVNTFLTLLQKVFHDIEDDEEETLLQKLLQKVMVCVYAAFPFHDPNAYPEPPRDDIDNRMDENYAF